MSSDASITFFLFLDFKCKANLPAVVVLPEPWRPTSNITAGGAWSIKSSDWSEPRTSIKTSFTIFITCWPGVTDLKTSSPTALTLTLSINSFTTDNATSASSNADRTSLSALSTSPSESEPLLVRPLKTLPSLSVKFSNM